MISIYLRNIFGKGEKPLGSDFPDHCNGENPIFLVPSDVSNYNTCMASPQRQVQAESRKDSQCQARSFFTESNSLNQCEDIEHWMFTGLCEYTAELAVGLEAQWWMKSTKGLRSSVSFHLNCHRETLYINYDFHTTETQVSQFLVMEGQSQSRFV